MITALLRKTIRDARWLLLACVATVFAFGWIRVVIVASIEIYRFQRIGSQSAGIHQAAFADPDRRADQLSGLDQLHIRGGTGLPDSGRLDHLRASDSVAGELSRGTLEMLLAQPIGRLRYLVVHSTVTVVGILLLATAAYVGTYIGVHTTSVKAARSSWQWRVPILGVDIGADKDSDEVPRIPMTQYVEPRVFRAAAINFACLGFFLAGITTALSSLDRYRWRTIGIVVGFYIVQSVLEMTGMAVEGCRWMLRLTFFSAYEPVAFTSAVVKDPQAAWRFLAEESQGMLPDLGPLGYDSVLLVWGLLGFVIAAVIFCRRDLPAPL